MLMTATARDRVENTIPVLAVADVSASIRFYCELLDFWRRADDASLRSTFLVQPRAIFARPCHPFGRRCWLWIDSTPVGVVQRSPGLADASANPGNTTLDSRTQSGFGRTLIPDAAFVGIQTVFSDETPNTKHQTRCSVRRHPDRIF